MKSDSARNLAVSGFFRLLGSLQRAAGRALNAVDLDGAKYYFHP